MAPPFYFAVSAESGEDPLVFSQEQGQGSFHIVISRVRLEMTLATQSHTHVEEKRRQVNEIR